MSESRPGMGLAVVIVDDEPLGRDCVRLGLDGLEDVAILAECANGHEAVAAIRRLQPDLVFLDVQMPGMSGFEVIERIGTDAMPVVVFVTAFEEHAVHAFDVHAVDYLLKPFDDERIHRSVERARHHLAARNHRELRQRLTALLSEFGPHTEDPAHGAGLAKRLSRLAIKQDDRIRFVETEEVDWFEASGNNVRFHVGSQTFQIRSTMRRLLEQLDPDRFVRIHRSTIVNMRRIKEVQPWVGGDYLAILRDGAQLKVSRNYRQRLLGR